MYNMLYGPINTGIIFLLNAIVYQSEIVTSCNGKVRQNNIVVCVDDDDKHNIVLCKKNTVFLRKGLQNLNNGNLIG